MKLSLNDPNKESLARKNGPENQKLTFAVFKIAQNSLVRFSNRGESSEIPIFMFNENFRDFETRLKITLFFTGISRISVNSLRQLGHFSANCTGTHIYIKIILQFTIKTCVRTFTWCV